MQNFNQYLESLDESKIVLKRRYTENHPEKNVRRGANIRNTIIEALRDKKLTLSEFNEIVAQHSKSPNKWTQRNKRFFTIKEDNVTLSRYGNKIAKTLQPVNEGKLNMDKMIKAAGKELSQGADNNDLDMFIEDYLEKNRISWEEFDYDEREQLYQGLDIKYGIVITEGSAVNEKKVEPGKYSGLYYDTAEKVFKRERIKVGWALIDKWLEKAHAEGHLEYTAAYVKDAEKDIRAAIDKIGKKNMKMFAYESVVNEGRKEITKKHWDKADDNQREDWLLQAFSDPDDAIEYIESDWEDLPPQATSNMYESINEARVKNFRKVKVGDVGQDYNGEDVTIVAVGKLGKLMKYDDTGMAEDGLSQGYLNKNDDAVAVESPEGGFALFTYGEDGVAVYESINEAKAPKNWDSQFTMKAIEAYKNSEFDLEDDKSIAEWDKEYNGGRAPKPAFNTKEVVSYAIETGKKPNGDKMDESIEINERAKAARLLKDVSKGSASEVEGIKLSKEMAQAYLDWLKSSAYGKKFSDLPFEKLFKASFNWGIDRYTKDLKGEYKELKQKAKEMKESTIYINFSNFVNERYMVEKEVVESLNEMKEPKCSNKEGHLYKKIDKDGTVECIHCGLRNSLSESVEINEALKSSKLRNLLSMKKSPKTLFKAIYGATRIALDKVEDHQIVDVDPKQGPKQDGYVFYYTTQEKENPHAPDSYYNGKFRANTLLALAKGKKVFYVRHNYNRRGPNTYSLTTDPKGGFTRSSSATDIGPNKSYSGYDASGLGSLARVISIADAAFVINPDALETTHDKIEQRSQAKEGAIAFKDAREFKDANMARYKEILTQRSKSLDVDKEVVKAIEEVADIMKDGIKNKKKNRYNEIIMGTGKDGRDFKINDLTNFTSNLMADYERWSRYMKDAENAKERMEKEGADQRTEQWEIKYNEKEAAQYSKSIKDKLRKLKNRNLAW